MRLLFPLVLTLVLVSGCLATPTPTPIAVFQYPATWTPAPTPTFTPRPPTATLVIQRTPGAAQTRDPNLRILPDTPRSRVGLWMDVSAQTPPVLEELIGRAQLIVTDNTAAFSPAPGAAVFLATDTPPTASEALNPVFAGIVLTPTAATDIGAVRAAIAPKLLIANMSVTETLESELEPLIDGVRLESFLTEPESPLSQMPNQARWLRDLDALAKLSSNPNLLVLTSTRLGTDAGDGSVDADQWLRFALGSFLLAANGTHSFFGMASALTPQTMDSSLYGLQIGSPLGGPFQQTGVYQRRFTQGLVLVNPTNEARAITLSRNYVDGFGTRYDSVKMEPHTGMILLETE